MLEECNKIKKASKSIDNRWAISYNIIKIRNKKQSKLQEVNDLYEVVKVVNGYEIKRMVGTKGFYHVNVREGNGFREFHTFKTIKAAVEFIKTAL